MPIVHGADSIGTPSPDSLIAARMARVDGCPEACGNTELPRSVATTSAGFMAAYLCGDCGHAWSTGWRD